MSEYAFPLDEGRFVFRLRTAKGDLKKVSFYYADRADMASELTFYPLDMPLIRTDVLYDWYEVTLKTPWQRIAYYFLLDDGNEQCRFAGDCFERMDAHIERSEYFQYPFNHKADLAVVPDWVHDAIVYNIFPDSFADGKEQISRAGKKRNPITVSPLHNHLWRNLHWHPGEPGLYPGPGLQLPVSEPDFCGGSVS